MSEKAKVQRLSRVTKSWLTDTALHPLLSNVSPEFPKIYNADFIFHRLIGHHSANTAVIKSVPHEDTMVDNRLKSHVLDLIFKNRQVDPENKYPSEENVYALTREQATNIYDKLLANFINNLKNEEKLEKTYRFSRFSAHESDCTAEQLMLYSLQDEAEFSGYFLKFLDLYDLSRPNEITTLYGDGKAPELKGGITWNHINWLIKPEDIKEIEYPDNIRDLMIEIRNRIVLTNSNMYDSFSESLFLEKVGHNIKRRSSVRDDLVHEIYNLILRNIAVDEVLKTNPDQPYPSLVDLNYLKKTGLLKLYRIFGNRLMESFKDRDKFQEKDIEWFKNKLTPREFLILTLDHLSLHTGSLSFKFEHFDN
ncbi:MAG: hypothetical protein AAB437_00685 [Patescibacteria group bacterium]